MSVEHPAGGATENPLFNNERSQRIQIRGEMLESVLSAAEQGPIAKESAEAQMAEAAMADGFGLTNEQAASMAAKNLERFQAEACGYLEPGDDGLLHLTEAGRKTLARRLEEKANPKK